MTSATPFLSWEKKQRKELEEELSSQSVIVISLSPRTTELPLASQFGLAVVKTGSDKPSQLQLSFHLPSGTALSKAELCMISAVAEIADEVLNCTGEALRMGRLVEDVTANVEAYQANGQAVFRSMGLLKEELKVRKKRLSNSQVSWAVSVIKDHASHVEQVL